jgi:hypothetical protein
MKSKDNPSLITSLSAQKQQVLHNQIIDDNSPGTVLRDFEKLLEFIGPDGVSVSGKNNLFSLKLLPQLNAQMTRPIEISLRRPMQKSYPYINGLYLLLRAAGFAVVEGFGSRQKMIIDKAVLRSWQALNSTERYLTLFEIWMLKGDLAIIGEHGSFVDTPYINWDRFFKRIPKKGLKIAGNREEETFIIYIPGLYNVALMDLFGLVAVQHAKPESGKGWRIARVDHTPFGDALLALVTPYFTSTYYYLSRVSGEDKSAAGSLQPIFQPFFPEWRKNLIIPESEFQDGIYVFKVSLGSSWRRIAIPAQRDLDTLSISILSAFDFDHDHLYMFSHKNRFGMLERIYHPYKDEPPYANEVIIGELSLNTGNTMRYLYDFGDNWQFDVKLERIEPVDDKIKDPVLLESHGKSPEQYASWDEY